MIVQTASCGSAYLVRESSQSDCPELHRLQAATSQRTSDPERCARRCHCRHILRQRKSSLESMESPETIESLQLR